MSVKESPFSHRQPLWADHGKGLTTHHQEAKDRVIAAFACMRLPLLVFVMFLLRRLPARRPVKMGMHMHGHHTALHVPMAFPLESTF